MHSYVIICMLMHEYSYMYVAHPYASICLHMPPLCISMAIFHACSARNKHTNSLLVQIELLLWDGKENSVQNHLRVNSDVFWVCLTIARLIIGLDINVHVPLNTLGTWEWSPTPNY